MMTSKAGKGSRRPWVEEEDRAVHSLVMALGTRKWTAVADRLRGEFGIEGRSGKQCRERWHNHLDPNIIKRPWDLEEERLMFEAHSQLGNKWADIAKMLPGRSDNSIKNHFYSTVRKYCRKRIGVIASKTQLQTLDPQATASILASLRRAKGGRRRVRREARKARKAEEDSLWLEEVELPPLRDSDLVVEGHKLYIPDLPQADVLSASDFLSFSDEIFILPIDPVLS